MAEEPNAIREEIAATRQRMGDTVEALAYKADIKARVRDKIVEARDIVTTATESFLSSVRENDIPGTPTREGGSMSKTTSTTTSTTSETWEDDAGLLKRNPLAAAFGALAIGFLAGLLIPSTPAENERLGPVADQVKQTAKEAAQEAVDKGKAMATDAAVSATTAVKESVQDSGAGSPSGSSQSGSNSGGSSA
jgi:hypothetical protein